MQKRPLAVAQRQFLKHQDFLEGLSIPDRFAAIYKMNLWSANTSKSGLGFEIEASRTLAMALPELCTNLGVKTLVDAPCGDGVWISTVPLKLDQYIGIDIVPDLITDLKIRHSSDPRREYLLSDLINQPVPQGDLIICRDCLVHLSHENIWDVVSNFKNSNSTWLLTTHFTALNENSDIIDGDWRALNLCLPPYSWPATGFARS